jgi:hypothetical protein
LGSHLPCKKLTLESRLQFAWADETFSTAWLAKSQRIVGLR